MKKFRETGIGGWLQEDLPGASEYLLGRSTEFVAEHFEYQDASDFLYMLICAEKRWTELGDYRAGLFRKKRDELGALLRAKTPPREVDDAIPF